MNKQDKIVNMDNPPIGSTCDDTVFSGKKMTKLTRKEKQLLAILAGAEELIENLDVQGKDKKLGKVYKFIHEFNPLWSCYGVHGS